MKGRTGCCERFEAVVVPLLLATVGLVPPAHAFTQKGVGIVTALRGEAAVAHAPEVAARERRPAQEALKFREDVFFRDVIDTQRDSTAKLLLRGRSTFTIRELSRVELREGVVPADPTRTRSIVSLLTGAFRAIVQRDLRPQDELEIQTPNAISAVRGTDVVVEVYPSAAPPLPPSASYEPAVLLASLELAQIPPIPIPPGLVSRFFVFVGLLEVEGLVAGPLQGIEKVGTLPPRLFRFLPDFVNVLVARFALSAVARPQGAPQAQSVAALTTQAVGEAAARPVGPGPAGPLAPRTGPLPVERTINSLVASQNRVIPIDGPLSGILFFGSPAAMITGVTITLNDGTRLQTGIGDLAVIPAVPFGSAPFTGIVTGRAGLFGGASGSVLFRIGPTVVPSGSGPFTFSADLTGPLAINGQRLTGPASGPYKCVGTCSLIGTLSGTFR